eukprot:CAMPEP_0184513912 /NCGR_PEP_ID=MMETSP0198_2-20121128/3680_1 /TAXON_ID=1112570 /ORGANISM="Thraustochytrium sp., Strain LLF1b" /LENGTH=233 /DNA_ID=CAMNT_0026904061 /DNA_START=347 /DNA_END=1048 /DNA_ORIENTATION=+
MTTSLREDQLSEVAFNDENFVRAYGLHANNVLDYFALSPFYDSTCNNELVRMQKLGLEVLQNMKGVEYRLLHTGYEPVLFVVVKQDRSSPTIVRKQELFYILDKTIYSAPTLQRLIVSRLYKCATHVQNAFEKLNSAMHFAPSEGYTWHFEGEGYDIWRQSTESVAYETRRRRRDERLERRGEAEISSILNGLVDEHLPPNPTEQAKQVVAETSSEPMPSPDTREGTVTSPGL